MRTFVSSISEGTMVPPPDGSLSETAVEENRARFVKRKGVDPASVVTLRFGRDGNDSVIRLNGDARHHTLSLWSRAALCEAAYVEKPAALFGAIADCFPVSWESAHFIALSHHGRVGIANGLAERVAKRLVRAERQVGTRWVELAVWIGPGICVRHYEVGEEEARALAVAGWGTMPYVRPVLEKQGKYLLDLHLALVSQIDELNMIPGVVVEEITDEGRCTVESAELFSDRAHRYAEALGVSPKPWGRFGVLAVSN